MTQKLYSAANTKQKLHKTGFRLQNTYLHKNGKHVIRTPASADAKVKRWHGPTTVTYHSHPSDGVNFHPHFSRSEEDSKPNMNEQNKALLKICNAVIEVMQDTAIQITDAVEHQQYEKKTTKGWSDVSTVFSMDGINSDHMFDEMYGNLNKIRAVDGEQAVEEETDTFPPSSPLHVFGHTLYDEGFTTFGSLSSQDSSTTAYPRSPLVDHEPQHAMTAAEQGGEEEHETTDSDSSPSSSDGNDGDMSDDSDYIPESTIVVKPSATKMGKSLVLIVESGDLAIERDWGIFSHLASVIPTTKETNFALVHEILGKLGFGTPDYPTVLSFMDSLRSLAYEEDMVELIKNEVWTVLIQCWVLDEALSSRAGFNFDLAQGLRRIVEVRIQTLRAKPVHPDYIKNRRQINFDSV